ncbi:family 43 glycosylhydrolase [Ktedonobacter racemifer]|uniref:Glycoside hydrolase family 43 n=1 Tax=Ktedonobacter racemifer DSM 44963 TaxID=485913 RepID=D6TQB1_KTERA|nr:family 43 glycosylhydrolase [Ktedonobacter racemifer]EFH85759.1 glycoside hydrolase family 43 [Ktedonobacter racemifer DSM 44963]
MPRLFAIAKSSLLKRFPRYSIALLIMLLLFPLSASAQAASVTRSAQAQANKQAGNTYSNPIIAQTAADPTITKGLDGYYYVVATSDLWSDGSFHILPIQRSTDLVHWQFVGDAFPTRPDWVDPTAGLWAPDIQYFNHKYYMYYTVSNTKALPKYGTTAGPSSIGVAVANSPAGPWQDAGPSAGGSFQHGPIVPPRACVFNTDPNCYYWTIDPAVFTDHDGQRYMYYGSFFGGTLVQKLAPDGLQVTGPSYQIGHWDRYEGTYVIRHDVNGKAYYYNFSSSGNCCNGPESPYSVVVSRATSPLGPFIDQNGYPMETPSTQPVPTQRPSIDPAGVNSGAQGGGYPTLKQNGNKWRGIGHNAMITDLSGQDWIIYHGVDENDGWVKGSGISFRQLFMDRVDWTADGWPIVNDGKGPSLTNVAPVTTPTFGDNFNATTSSLNVNWNRLSGNWQSNAGDATTGGFVTQTGPNGQGLLVSQMTIPQGYRTELDLRLEKAGPAGRYGGVVSYRQEGDNNSAFIAAFIDPAHNTLVTVPYQNGHAIQGEQVTPLPANFDPSDWHHLIIDDESGQSGQARLRFTLSDTQRDPLAVQERMLPASFRVNDSKVGIITENAQADFDNIATAPLNHHVAPPQQTPQAGTLLSPYSDEFNGRLGPQWSWAHEDAIRHTFVNGQLSITINGDLYRNQNSATNLLLENQPAGNYMMETKLTFDPNTNYQQAGLLIYSDDDHYIKVGVTHHESLNKVIAGHETLDPTPGDQKTCDVQPSPTSNIAVKAYTTQQCPLEGESWDYLSNPQPTQNGSTATKPTVITWLRIYRDGNVYTPYSSVDGVHWIRGNAWDLSPVSSAYPIKIGLFGFSSGPVNTIPAYFDYVHVYNQP